MLDERKTAILGAVVQEYIATAQPVGSTHIAEEARKAGKNIAGMFTNDIIGSSRAEDGRVDRGRVRLFAEGVPDVKEMSDELLPVAAQLATKNAHAKMIAHRSFARAFARMVLVCARPNIGFSVGALVRRQHGYHDTSDHHHRRADSFRWRLVRPGTLVLGRSKSVKEIAGIIGIAEATVKTRMFYARKKLAALVATA